MKTPRLLAVIGLMVASSVSHAQEVTLKCPIAQDTARNGDKPNPDLLKKLIRCRKGEKPADPGYDGAVTVEVTDLKVAAPREWDYRRDSGSGDRGTKVYPVKVTYTERTHYKSRTEVSEGWIRIMNFYVDGFGEWRSGSEESIQAPKVKSIPK